MEEGGPGIMRKLQWDTNIRCYHLYCAMSYGKRFSAKFEMKLSKIGHVIFRDRILFSANASGNVVATLCQEQRIPQDCISKTRRRLPDYGSPIIEKNEASVFNDLHLPIF
ncbi:hypothetical protein L345_05077, partial [Ophiophagus hannah]